MRRQSERGFTLIELMLALAIIAALLAVAFGGLRVGLSAWRQGEDRAEGQQHARSLTQALARALAGTYPYRAPAKQGTPAELLFRGEAERVSFVTVAPPLPASLPVAFTAVTLSMDEGKPSSLAIRQKVLPNTDPFESVKPDILDASVYSIQFRYLRSGGSWDDSFQPTNQEPLPKAVEITVIGRDGERLIEYPAFTAPVRVTQ